MSVISGVSVCLVELDRCRTRSRDALVAVAERHLHRGARRLVFDALERRDHVLGASGGRRPSSPAAFSQAIFRPSSDCAIW